MSNQNQTPDRGNISHAPQDPLEHMIDDGKIEEIPDPNLENNQQVEVDQEENTTKPQEALKK